jgi:hypothetical protein
MKSGCLSSVSPQKRLGKMETRRRRRAGTCFSGEDGLIGLFRRRRIGDIGRQRNIADRIRSFRTSISSGKRTIRTPSSSSSSTERAVPSPRITRIPACSLLADARAPATAETMSPPIEAAKFRLSQSPDPCVHRGGQAKREYRSEREDPPVAADRSNPKMSMFEAFDVPSENEQSR